MSSTLTARPALDRPPVLADTRDPGFQAAVALTRLAAKYSPARARVGS